jgi:hypothetical protein
MFGLAALKSATTLSSTVFCSGASPPPRQQYQRISTTPPGAVDSTGGCDAAVAVLLGAGAAGDELAVPAGPQALNTRVTAAMSDPTLKSLVRMVLLSMIPPGR